MILHEKWEKDDERILRAIKRTIEYMRKIDGLAYARYDIKSICDQYSAQALVGVEHMTKMMRDMRAKSGVNIKTGEL